MITSVIHCRSIRQSTELSSVEKYEVGATESTVLEALIPTPRAFGQTVYTNDKIYCIGGLEYDAILKTFVVSRKIEYLDIVSETWMPSLASMPENYGIAFGAAEVVGNEIFVMCGVNSVSGDCEPGQLNTKILKYDISADDWEILEPSDSALYPRISPFALLASLFLTLTSPSFSLSISISKSLKDCNSRLLRQRLSVSSRWYVGIQTDILGCFCILRLCR